jgi:signal peptidase II
MASKTRLLLILVLNGFFLCIDQFLKWQSLHTWSEPRLLHRFFGWDPFLNPGIAFSIPVPSAVIILLSVPVIFFILYILLSKKRFWSKHVSTNSEHLRIPLIFILTGAVSNLIDRVLYHNTVDYLLVFTGVINIADVLIVVGFLLYFKNSLKPKDQEQTS